MGATKPDIQRTYRQVEPQGSFPLIPLVLLALLAFLISMPRRDVTNQPAAPSLEPREQQKLDKRLREIDDSEQYALIAATDGWYPCLHSGQSTYYLHAGEVWKYGVTSKGKFGRYSVRFLKKHRVSYVIEFKGNYAECLKQEQIRLFHYPYLPENLARPPAMRLPRPPYNPIMR